MVGFARTATYRSQAPADRPAAEMAAQRADYYAYVEAGPGPGISVLQDLDPEAGYGAFYRKVLSETRKVLSAIETYFFH